MRKIVIEVSGGNIQEIYSTEKENDSVAVYVIDWDNIEAGQEDGIEEFSINYINKSEINQIIEEANSKIKKNANT